MLLSLIYGLAPCLYAEPTPVQPTGSGTDIDPYQVGTLANLYWITQNASSWDSYFEQTADIDVSSSSSWASGQGFSPIGKASPDTAFTGSYNGLGHYLDGITINRGTNNYTGLFGYVDGGTISDLGVTNANITGKYWVGALVGHQRTSSSVSRCYSTGTVTGTEGYIGGLVGQNYYSTITDSYSRVIVDSKSTAGGLCGNNNSGTIIRCFSTGTVDGDFFIMGLSWSSSGSSVVNSFWDTETSGILTSNGGTGKTTAEMMTESTFTDAGWDFTGESANGNDDTWSIDGSTNDGYPFLTTNQPPEIPTPITLTSFTATPVNGTVELAWETASETNNANFVIYRNDVAIASLAGAGTTSEPHTYSYVDDTVIPGVTYTYVLADVDYANEETKYTDNAITVSVANDLVETDFVVGAAYPNPFNPSVTINYQLSNINEVKAYVYDLNGTLMLELLNKTVPAGDHSLTWHASDMPSGVYILKMLSGNVASSQKLVLMK